jgi:hypothetical protein
MQEIIRALQDSIPCLLQQRGEKTTNMVADIKALVRDYTNSPNSEPVRERVLRLAAVTATYIDEGGYSNAAEHINKLRSLMRHQQQARV